MLQYKNFTFDSKQDFINYIEKRMTDYWESHNDSFSRVCEELDSYDGFLDGNRFYSMYELDDLLYDEKPSDIVRVIDNDFNYADNYFYYDDGRLCSTDEKDYSNYVDYSDVFDKLIDDYGKIFNYHYGRAYYELFDNVYDIINNYDEDEIQDCLNDDYYYYLFGDDDDFFWNDDLDN